WILEAGRVWPAASRKECRAPSGETQSGHAGFRNRGKGSGEVRCKCRRDGRQRSGGSGCPVIPRQEQKVAEVDDAVAREVTLLPKRVDVVVIPREAEQVVKTDAPVEVGVARQGEADEKGGGVGGLAGEGAAGWRQDAR